MAHTFTPDAFDGDEAPSGPRDHTWKKRYRYGQPYEDGSHTCVVLWAEDYKKKGSNFVTSFKLELGFEGTQGPVRFNAFVPLKGPRLKNLLEVFDPKALAGEPFDTKRLRERHVVALIETEDSGGEYGPGPKVTRFVKLLSTRGDPGAADAAQSPAGAAQSPAPVSDDDLPF